MIDRNGHHFVATGWDENGKPDEYLCAKCDSPTFTKPCTVPDAYEAAIPVPLTRNEEEVVNLLNGSGFTGMTWWELAEAMKSHHGRASGALSNLHRKGRIARLTLKRGNCSVYVSLGWVGGRDTVAPGRQAARKQAATEERERIIGLLEAGMFTDAARYVRNMP